MRNGDLRAEDYAGALLDRAQHLESLNAFRTLDKQMVLEAARAADKVRACGDAIGSEGIRGAFKTYSLPPNRPSQDAYESALVQRQRMREEIRRHFELHGITTLAFPPIMVPPPLIGAEAEVTIGGQQVPLNVAMARNTSLASCASMASLILACGDDVQRSAGRTRVRRFGGE